MASDITLTGGAGEYMESATVVNWTVAPGAFVRKGEVVVVVETAKAATEIEAPCDGVLAEVLAEAGSEVEIGHVLGRVGQPGEIPARRSAAAASPAYDRPSASETAPLAPLAPVLTAPARVLASPLARRTAAQHGLDLAGIAGTGPGRRIKQRDVEAALRVRTGERADEPAWSPAPPARIAGSPAKPPTPTATLVLIHGFGASAAAWNGLLPLLRPYPCLALNLPAHGSQRRVADHFDGLVRSAMRDLEEAGVERLHLVGHSLGGAVAAEIAASSAFEVRSVTLLAPAGLGPNIDGAFLDGFGRATTESGLRPWLGRLVADPALLSHSYAAAILRERARFSLAAPQSALRKAIFPDGGQTIDIRAQLRRLACPTRIIWGARDTIIPAEHAHGLGGAVGLHLIDTAGHMPHVEEPALTARLILENLRSGTGSTML